MILSWAMMGAIDVPPSPWRKVLGLLSVFYIIAHLSGGDARAYQRPFCHGRKMYIYCQSGFTIKIQSATWGRQSNSICRNGNVRNTHCAERVKSLAVVRKACQGKGYCTSIPVTTAVFGDPCPGTSKYLHVRYTCAPPNVPTIGPAAVPSAAGCKVPGAKADVYFVVDSSGSIGTVNFIYMKRFMNVLINSMPVGPNAIRFGLITFASSNRLVFPLNRYYTKAALRQKIRNLKYISGSTGTSAALSLLRTRGFTANSGDRKGVKDIAILITDGVPNSQPRTMQQAMRCKKAGVEFFIVAVQMPSFAVVWAKRIAHTTHSHYYVLRTFHTAIKQVGKISKQVCTMVNKFSFPKMKNSRKKTPANKIINARYSNLKTTKCKSGKADLYFVLDSSGSVGRKNWVHIVSFVDKIIAGFPVGSNAVRVGVIRYSSRANLLIPLNRYYQSNQLQRAIRNLPFLSGGTSTSQALRILTTRAFLPNQGSRRGVKKIAVLVTDGSPNNVQRTTQEAMKCRQRGIELFSIAAQAPRHAVAHLRRISHTAHAHFNVIPRFQTMVNQAGKMGKAICNSMSTCKSNVPADIYFMIDASGSVTSKNFPFLLKFVSSMIDSLPLGQNATRVGVYRYEHRINLLIPLDKYYNKAKLKQAVKNIKYTKGLTFTDQVLKAMRTSGFTAKNGARKGVLDIGVLITDGLSTFRKKTLKESDLCKQAGIQLFAVGVNVPSNVEIQQIGSKPKKDHVFTIRHFPDLLHKARDIHHKMCENINRIAKACKKVDLYFVVDASENLQKSNFPKALAFVNSVIDTLTVSSSKVRVGLIIYDAVAKLIVPLNKYYAVPQLKAAVSKAKFTGGGCNIADAVKAIRTLGFTAKNGDRPGVHNMAILISSGIIYGHQQTLVEAAATRKAGIELLVVGVAVPNMAQLSKLASPPTTGHVFSVKTVSKLTTKTTMLSKLICKKKPACKHNTLVDIYFVVDASENLQKANFPKALDFVNTVIDSLPLGLGTVRAGVMVFDAVAKLKIPLNKYYTPTTMKAAVKQIKFTGGGCSVSDAVKAMRTVGFTAKNGDRLGVHNMAVLISSGILYGYQQTLVEARATKQSGVELFVVGVNVPNMSQLTSLASNPTKEHVFPISKVSKLKTKADDYANLICKTINKHPARSGF